MLVDFCGIWFISIYDRYRLSILYGCDVIKC